MGFQEEYANIPGGPQREQAVYRAIISQGKPTDLWPMTVDGPGGSKITYYITRDFLHVGNIYPGMTGTTAQKVADYFGMYLPSNTISDQVWKAAKGKINVPPLSGTGYQGRDRHYSPQEVVNSRIGATDANIAFSNKIQEAMQQNPNTQKELIDIGQGGKWITMPPASNSLGLHGIRTSDNPRDLAQSGYGTIHPNYEDHAEYGSLVRLVDNRVTIEKNGKSETIPMDEFVKRPEHTALFVDGQDIREGGMARYDLKRDKAQLASIDKEVGPGQQPAGDTSTTPVDQFLNQLSTQMSVAQVADKLIRKYAGTLQIMQNIGKDPAIKDISQSSIPGHPPEGYEPLPAGEKSGDIGKAARQILENSSLGDQVPFKIGDQLYMGRSEPHFHPAPTAAEKASMSEAELNAKYPAHPWGWHRGVTVFKALEGTSAPNTGVENTPPESGVKGRMSMLERIDNFLDGLKSGL